MKKKKLCKLILRLSSENTFPCPTLLTINHKMINM